MNEPDTPHPTIKRFVVVIPAHDEVNTLPGALASVAAAAAEVTADVEVLVVLDACTDGTETAVGPGVATVVVDSHNVGCARLAGFAGQRVAEDIWFATTDADSRVPRNWLSAQSMAAATGADAFVGTITPDDWSGWHPGAATSFAESYTNHDGHRHVHGANLGFRSTAYLAAGGFAPLVEHEDVDLVSRLAAAGVAIAWSAQAPVSTSTRRTGRTPGGFAGALPHLTEPMAR